MSEVIWVVQPYVPSYRLPFFELLRARLAALDLDLRVAAGTPTGDQAQRADAESAEWLVPIRTRTLGPAVLSQAPRETRSAAGVIYPHMGTWLELDARLALRYVSRKGRIGVWGHIGSYVSDPNAIDAAIERWQLRHADHVFAYTDGGAVLARAAGVVTDRLTVLHNTIDTTALETAIRTLTDEDVAEFQSKHSLTKNATLAYIGGLDQSKRVDVLVRVLDVLAVRRPDIRVLIGGRGADEYQLETAEARGQVVRLGYVGPREKALIARSASVILNPGRVGLIAVDALVMGLPIVTVASRYHAPEIEYLCEGKSLHTADSATVLPALVLDLLASASSSPHPQWEYPRIFDMVEAFTSGVQRMLA